MKIMLLIAHGSRKQSANDEIAELAARVQAIAGDRYDAVLPAFLELAEPDIHQVIDTCASMGATEIVAVPYFLAAGKHVARDIPSELECARAGHPDIRIDVAPYVGGHDSMPDMVLRCALQSA